MVVTAFSIEGAWNQRKQRIKAICDYYQVSTFWGQDMSIDEIEWFEKKIEEDRSNEKEKQNR